MGIPEPLNWRPSISVLIGILSTSPVNSQCVFMLSISDVPSKIYTKIRNAKTRQLCAANNGGKCKTYLDDCTFASDFEHLALTGLSISELHVNDLGVPVGERRLHVIAHHRRTQAR